MNGEVGGWGALGDLLSGAPALRAQEAGMRGMQQRASLDDLFARARERQLESISREGLPDALKAIGVQNPDAGATILNSGLPLRNLTGGLGDLQTQAITQHAVDLANLGDVDALNLINAVRKGVLIPRTAVQGNTVIDPYSAPAAQQINATPLGNAMMGAERAQAGKYGAEAGAAGALAEKRRVEARHVGDPKPGAQAKEPPVALSDAQALARGRALIAQGKDPKKVMDYLTKLGYPRVAGQLVGNASGYLDNTGE
jgi:hypothetical protein